MTHRVHLDVVRMSVVAVPVVGGQHIGGFLGGALLAYLIGPRYAVKVSPDQTIVQINDTRPLTGQFPVVIYFAAGLVAALIVTVLT